MRTYAYKKMDAFTSGLSLGNPAAFLDLQKDTLSDHEMLKIAKAHKGFVSEIVFLSRNRDNGIKLTYYSSECEVDFCGHGTIATMYEVIQTDRGLNKKSEFTIETHKKGALTIYNRIHTEDAVYITAPTAVWLENTAQADEIAKALKIDSSIISHQYPVDFIDAGLKTLIVPITGLNEEISIYPDIKELEIFCIHQGIDIILIFSNEVSNADCFAHTRVFAPRFGYLEDPATGSGNSAFGNYLLKNHLWEKEAIKIEQGNDHMIYNEVKLLKKEGKVLFGGKAKKKIEGVYYLE